MKLRFPIIFYPVVALLLAAASLQANTRDLDIAARRADRLGNKRVVKQMWTQPQGNSLTNKRFPIEQWDKHYSSVGSKRSPISMQENAEKKMFRSKTFERKKIDFEMSRWNERVVDLHQKAGIKMDDQARLAADQQLYRMLQNTQQFSEMGDEVSLRDVNRFQFRRNRSDEAIPVQAAGAGQ